MLVTAELSRQIDSILPGLLVVVQRKLAEIRKPSAPEETPVPYTELLARIGNISLLIKKTREYAEAIKHG